MFYYALAPGRAAGRYELLIRLMNLKTIAPTALKLASLLNGLRCLEKWRIEFYHGYRDPLTERP